MIHRRRSLTGRMKVHTAATMVVVVTTVWARADVFVPPGLNPGDTFQLVFVTGSVENPSSNDIGIYNEFVQTEAAKHPLLTGTDMEVTYRVIASTSSVDARDNALVSAPVYRLDGQLVASGFDDMWDGSIQAPISLEAGRTFCSFDPDPDPDPDYHPCTDYVWTGSGPDGRVITDGKASYLYLGSSRVALGDASRSDGSWLIYGVYPSFEFDWGPFSAGFYALSEPLTVPLPRPRSPSRRRRHGPGL